MRGLPRRRPEPGDTVVAIGIDGQPSHSLVFGRSDLAGWWPSDLPEAGVRLSLSTTEIADVETGITTGTAAVMSGRVRIDGDRSALVHIGRHSAGPGFRRYASAPDTLVRHDGAEVVVVLGAPNDPAGVLSTMAMDRLLVAADACRRSPRTGLILCGGFGAHFNTTGLPHWKHCEDWLVRHRVLDPGRITGRVDSNHTYEDVLLLRELLRSRPPRSVTVITSDYHADRARFVLDLVLPGTDIVAVPHPSLSPGERERLRRHDERSLVYTVAAALVFGVDRHDRRRAEAARNP